MDAKINGRKSEEKQDICVVSKYLPQRRKCTSDKLECYSGVSVQNFPLKYVLWFKRQVNQKIGFKIS